MDKTITAEAKRAVDINAVVCLLTGDDASQTRHAAALFKKEFTFITKTQL